MTEILRRWLPLPVGSAARRILWRLRRPSVPAGGPTGLTPVSEVWGLDRGTPIDVHYLERFLSRHVSDITGRTLETGDARYSRKFGRQVTRADVLHIAPGNPEATIVGDLETGRGIPEGAFDCIVLTNTLLLLFDLRAAIEHCHRALRPGGVLLAHFTGLVRGQVAEKEWLPGWQGDADLWRFTSASARRLVADRFGPTGVTVESYGNVRAVTAALYGLAAEELTPEELGVADPRYEMVIGVRAVRAPG